MLPRRQLLDIGLAPDLDVLQRRLVAAAEDLDFGLVNATLIRGDLSTRHAWVKTVDNTPAAFLAAQRSWDDALRDPVMDALRAGGEPVLYDQSTYVNAGVADLWDAQAPFGYRGGVAGSLHESSHLEVFIFGMDRHAPLPKEPTRRTRLAATVQMLTVHAQTAMQRLLTPAQPASPPPDAIELECLRWASGGLTVWQVGDKVSISDAQVRQHQRSAARKLGVRSTPAAVLRCIEGGLIGR